MNIYNTKQEEIIKLRNELEELKEINIKIYSDVQKKYDNEIINQIIYYKVLPRIKFSKSNEDYLRFYNDFIDSLPEGIAKEKAIKMKSSGRVIQFWEN